MSRNSVDLNLDTLKREILDYLAGSEFAVFRSHPGGLEGVPMVCWDCDRYPDYREFLEAARKTGAKMVLCASREFEVSEVDESIEQLEDCDLVSICFAQKTKCLSLFFAQFWDRQK